MQVYPDTFKKKSNEDDLYNICLGLYAVVYAV